MEQSRKYQELYIEKYGYGDLIPIEWFNSSKFSSVEEVYNAALEQGITWRKLTGWNEDRKKDIEL